MDNIEVRDFTDSDKDYAINLLKSREVSIDFINDLPNKGVISFQFGLPVCMGFLRKVESNTANTYMLDSLITHAEIDPAIRDSHVDLVVSKLIKYAKLNQINRILATTSDKNTIVRAMKHGFEVLPHTVIALDLSK